MHFFPLAQTNTMTEVKKDQAGRRHTWIDREHYSVGNTLAPSPTAYYTPWSQVEDP